MRVYSPQQFAWFHEAFHPAHHYGACWNKTQSCAVVVLAIKWVTKGSNHKRSSFFFVKLNTAVHRGYLEVSKLTLLSEHVERWAWQAAWCLLALLHLLNNHLLAFREKNNMFGTPGELKQVPVFGLFFFPPPRGPIERLRPTRSGCTVSTPLRTGARDRHSWLHRVNNGKTWYAHHRQPPKWGFQHGPCLTVPGVNWARKTNTWQLKMCFG